MSVIVSRGNHMFHGEGETLKTTEKQLKCIMGPETPMGQKNIDCQVSKVSVFPDSPSYKHPYVELKELPPHLEYVFLEQNSKLTVIISLMLEVGQKEKLVTMLREH